ncbi:hypothetical protein NK718_02000 [Alsobacter sp. SYSU M60028]|uniref:Uncharacterized protein n=1 Tax=Alsobacter ponti TaxID=2962936 RepID=A0ABT1L749_9HYPH|nr:hypothetical protein [Alsobacter ponti]MCP8937275.1 hypothetical protein [Alsobacter ponti]
MTLSRLLPTAAFAVAVSAFFAPPMLTAARIGGTPPAPQPRLSVDVRETAQLPTVRRLTRSADLCAPAQAPAASVPGPSSPAPTSGAPDGMRRVVASLAPAAGEAATR